MAADLEQPGRGLRGLAQERDDIVAVAKEVCLAHTPGPPGPRSLPEAVPDHPGGHHAFPRRDRLPLAGNVDLGEGIVGGANLLEPGEALGAEGEARDLQGGVGLRRDHVPEVNAVARDDRRRKVRPPGGVLRRELDLSDRSLLRRERGQEGVGGVHDRSHTHRSG